MLNLQVAVGVIFDSQQRILITQRPHHVAHGGYWEFPGGKIEVGETPEQALYREIQEELGLFIQAAKLSNTIEHAYHDKKVQLFVFYITQFHGNAACRVKQLDLRWAKPQELAHYRFPEANLPIITQLSCL